MFFLTQISKTKKIFSSQCLFTNIFYQKSFKKLIGQSAQGTVSHAGPMAGNTIDLTLLYSVIAGSHPQGLEY